ncbi:MAG: TrkH family potassium uptake protein [Clostridiales bacterium]|nr:TrkH family potassium uptake protein [Clostridiales bacterium]MDD7036192.1 TrkH family potassium uptake protein [Bacillota bacterium]MDY2920743.1 TrkH family potassium uptake protein [Lentihominibacter sp.]
MVNVNINYKAMVRILGIIILITGLAMAIPWIFAEVTGDTASLKGFRIGVPVSVVLGGLLSFFLKSDRAKFRVREGYIVVASCWAVAILAGTLPYYFSSFTDSFIDALFESTSGFTTTGCSAVAGDPLSDSLLLWKAITNWMGGMGILVLAISILPALGVNGQFIVRAEAPGPAFQKTTVRMSDSAKVLYVTYFAFTLIEFILLMLSGKMPAFDALIATMGSISTGGLTVHPEGIAFYDSIFVEVVISAFCILSSVNFVLYHYLVTGKGSYLLKDIELRAYLIIILAAILICTAGLVFVNGDEPGTALRDAGFQVVSMATTAGYTRSPYVVWPVVCQITLIVLMFIGGCSSSTAGSIKVVRVLVMLKLIFRGGTKRVHPRSVVAVKLGRNAVSAPVVSAITAFILTYMLVLLVSVFILSFQGFSLDTTLTAALAMLSNTGAAFGEAAASGNFSMFHPVLKLYLSGLMIMGRLELFTIMILFSRTFWGKNH